MNKKFLTFFTLLIAGLIFVSSVNAQCSPCGAGQTCLGSTCVSLATSLRPEFQGPGSLANIISRFFSFVIPIMGILGFLFFLWSAIQYLTSKGDPKALQSAQARLTYAVVGLIIIALAYTLTNFFTFLFGLNSV